QLAAHGLPADVQWEATMGITTDAGGAQWLCSSQQGVMVRHGGKLHRILEVPELAGSCSAVYADRRGRVWFGFTGGGVTVTEGRAVQRLGEAEGLPGGPVLSILEDRSGTVWIITVSGVSRYRDGRFTTVTERNG